MVFIFSFSFVVSPGGMLGRGADQTKRTCKCPIARFDRSAVARFRLSLRRSQGFFARDPLTVFKNDLISINSLIKKARKKQLAATGEQFVFEESIRVEQIRNWKIAPWVLGLLLLACVSCPRSDPRALKVGLIADLAGPMAPYGIWARNGVDIALSEINSAANQSASLHILRRDARSDSGRALAAAEELISEGAQALIVATTSGTVLRIAPLCQRRQVVLLSPTASSASISSAGEFIFRNRTSSARESAGMGFYAAEKLGFRAVGLAVSDDKAGTLYETAFRQAFEADGGRIVRTVLLKPGQTDCQTQAAELKGAPALEAVFLGSTAPAHESAWLIRHAANLGFRPQWLGVMNMSAFDQHEGFAQPQNADAVRVAGNLLEGLLYASETFDRAATPSAQAFARKIPGAVR